MSRRTRSALLATAVGLAAATAPLLAGPAAAAPAQTAPLDPVDALLPILQPLQPVLEVVSPVVWPLCANAVLVNILPGALGIAIPPALSTVTGPLLVLCGSVPEPKTNHRVCALDQAAQDVLAQLTTPLIGSGLPIEVAPAKWVSGLLDNIVDLLDVKAVPQGSTVAAVLQCTDPAPTASTTSTTAAPAATGDTTPPPAVDLPAAPVDPPTFAELQTLPPLDPAEVALPATPVTPVQPVVAPRVRLISQPRFRYPVVMGLPLVFLALVAFFGRALTRPLVPTDDQEAR